MLVPHLPSAFAFVRNFNIKPTTHLAHWYDSVGLGEYLRRPIPAISANVPHYWQYHGMRLFCHTTHSGHSPGETNNTIYINLYRVEFLKCSTFTFQLTLSNAAFPSSIFPKWKQRSRSVAAVKCVKVSLGMFQVSAQLQPGLHYIRTNALFKLQWSRRRKEDERKHTIKSGQHISFTLLLWIVNSRAYNAGKPKRD